MHTVGFDRCLRIATITYSGQLTVSDIERGCRSGVDLILEEDCNRVLIDSREVDLAASTLELFHLAKTLAAALAEHNIEIRTIHRALVVKEINDDHLFIENVATNNGHTVKVFDNIIQAKKWLSD